MDKSDMDIGIVCAMVYPQAMTDERKLVEAVNVFAKDDYFSAVEIGYVKNKAIKKQLRSIIKASKLRLSVSGHGLILGDNLNINSLDEIERNAAVEALKKGIDFAYEMKAESFSFLSRGYEVNRIDDYLESLIKSTIELCIYGKRKGNMMILHEGFDNEIDKKALIGPTPLAKEYAQRVISVCDNFGLMVDLSHFPQLSEGIEESIEPIKEYIKHAHMGNCVVMPGQLAFGDKHPRFGFQNGSNDVDEVKTYLVKLDEIGYFAKAEKGFISFEVRPWEDEDPELVIVNAKRTLNEALLLMKK